MYMCLYMNIYLYIYAYVFAFEFYYVYVYVNVFVDVFVDVNVYVLWKLCWTHSTSNLNLFFDLLKLDFLALSQAECPKKSCSSSIDPDQNTFKM